MHAEIRVITYLEPRVVYHPEVQVVQHTGAKDCGYVEVKGPSLSGPQGCKVTRSEVMEVRVFTSFSGQSSCSAQMSEIMVTWKSGFIGHREGT